MKKSFLLLFMVTALFSSQLMASKSAAGTNETDYLGRPVWQENVISVKFSSDVKGLSDISGPASTGLVQLDNIMNEFRVQKFERRFIQKALPKNSNLPDLSNIYVMEMPADASIQMVINRLNAMDEVVYAERIPNNYEEAIPNDTYWSGLYANTYALLYHLSQIHAEDAWDVHKGENGTQQIVVGICDTGYDWKHPDLAANVYNNLGEDADNDGHVLELVDNEWVFDPGDINGVDDDNNGYVDDFIGWNMMANASGSQNNNPMDPVTRGHGSHCSGLAAGVTNNENGIASISWNVKLTGTSHGYEGDNGASIYNAYQGIIYLAENGADVINTSWGGTGYSQAAEEIIRYATGLGAIIVSSAGNAENSVHQYPSDYPHVVSVAAVDRFDQKAWYSSYGIGVDVSCPGGNHVPGLLSTVPYTTVEGYPGYDFYSGTSMASPVVVGLIGLIKSYHPDWSNEQLVNQLIATTDNIDATTAGYENLMGSGRVNAYRALTETDALVEQVLELELWDAESSNNAVFDGMMAPGESAVLNFIFRNYSQLVSDTLVNFTLSSEDPGIVILNSSYLDTVAVDDYSRIEGNFTFKISDATTTHTAILTLTVDAPHADVRFADKTNFSVVISTINSAPSYYSTVKTYGDTGLATFTISNFGIDPIDYKVLALKQPAPYFHLDKYGAYEGDSWWCGDPAIGGYANSTLQYMDLPLMDFSAVTAPTLSFFTRWYIETPDGATSPFDGWDGANVWVSTDSGASFNVMTPTFPDYSAESLFSFGYEWGMGPGIPGWAGTQSTWIPAEFDLSSYKAKNVVIRFGFASDVAVTSTGLFLDNIKVADGATTIYENDGVQDQNLTLQGFGGNISVSEWMSVPVGSGTVAANGKTDVTVKIDTRMLEPGSHSGLVRIVLDGDIVVGEIPVSLYVNSPEHDIKLRRYNVTDDKFTILEQKPVLVSLENRGKNTEKNFQIDFSIYNGETVVFNDVLTIDSLAVGDSMIVYTEPYLPLNGGEFDIEVNVLNVADDYNAFNDVLSNPVTVNNLLEDFSFGGDKWEFDGMGITEGLTGYGDVYSVSVDTSGLPYGPNRNTTATFKNGLPVSDLDHGFLKYWLQYYTEENVDICYLEVSSDKVNWEARGAHSGKQQKWKQFMVDFTDLISAGADTVWFRFHFVSNETTQPYGLFIDEIEFFNDVYTGVVDNTVLPTTYALNQNYPNPFNPVTKLAYSLPEASPVTMTIYDVTGRKIREWNFTNQAAGWYELTWDGSNQHGAKVSAGLYFYQMKSNQFIATRKMVFMK